jgi:hypothetical protein
MDGFFGFLDLSRLPEYIFRAAYVVILGAVLTACYLFAFYKSKRPRDAWLKVPAFLGFTEAAVVLGSLNALFLAFVAIQFRYFFGGVANIGPSGMTYAEYARQGFAELVIVAFFSLLVFLLLSAVTKRKAGEQKWFSALSVGLVLLVAVILFSAFRRLLLYEEAFGFTRQRIFPHVFMVWLAILLAALAVLEMLRRQRRFAVAVLLAGLGFALTLPAINVDALIVRANAARSDASHQLDFQYLASLSPDALPELAAAYSAAPQGELRLRLAAALTCYEALDQSEAQLPWQSWSWPRASAAGVLAGAVEQPGFPSFTITSDPAPVESVDVESGVLQCYRLGWD